MNAITAVLFAAMGDKPKETEFFARMATAGYPNREFGHTGQGFSYLWSALGAAVGGPETAAEFFRKSSWHLDLVRRSDGSFTYDGGEQYGAGQTHDNTYYGNSSYNGLSPAATYVLTYSLPLKKLVITGRDANPKGWLNKQEAAVTVAAGHFDLDRRAMSPAELVAAFGNWSPIVRGWAAQELATRPESKTMVPELIKLAESGDPHQIQGACEALGLINTAEALPVLVKQLAHPDRCVRYKAAEAVKKMGETAKPAIEDILKALVATAEPSWPIRWEDPVQIAHGQLAAAVFSGPLQRGTQQSGSQVALSSHPRGIHQSGWLGPCPARTFFQNQLSEDDVIALAPVILAAVESSSPADTMFNNSIRMAGLTGAHQISFRRRDRGSGRSGENPGWARQRKPHGRDHENDHRLRIRRQAADPSAEGVDCQPQRRGRARGVSRRSQQAACRRSGGSHQGHRGRERSSPTPQHHSTTGKMDPNK